ncbi:MAG: hypothetical protein ACREAY_07475 [Nitrososphaera sp.]
MGNLQLDWLLISSILSVTIFVTTNIAVFVWLLKFKPEVLRSKGIEQRETTYNWNVIGGIVLQCSSFSGGIVLLINILVFMITGIWNVDAKSLGILALAFAMMLFRSFDKFVTGLRRQVKG